MPIGQKYTDDDYYLKWAVFGGENTGKTHFGVESALFRPKKNVLFFNIEPTSNLIPILKKFPEVEERTTVIPTEEDLDIIAEKSLERSPTDSMATYDAEVAWFILEKVIELERTQRNEIKNSFIVFDTASQIHQKLSWEIFEKREFDEKLMRLGPLGYTKAKQKFQIMINRTALWPTDVIWLGRTKQGGEEVVDRETGKTRWKPVPGKEDPEWGNMMSYPASVIMYLTRKEEHLVDENNSFILDSYGNPLKEEVRYAKIVKHKSGRTDVPVIRNPSPSKVVSWLRGLDVTSI